MSERFQQHVAAEDLALYVIGALAADRCNAVETHVMGCGVCADGLAREARLEAAFDEVARRAVAQMEAPAERPARVASGMGRRPLARRNGRFMGGVAGALAAAAAIVLMFAETSRADQGASAAQVHAGAYDGAVGDISGALVATSATTVPEKLDGG